MYKLMKGEVQVKKTNGVLKTKYKGDYIECIDEFTEIKEDEVYCRD
jgi:hypothetical protein